MPKGHKGGHREFTNYDSLEEARKKEENKRYWRKMKGEADSESDAEDEDEESTEEQSDDESSSKQEQNRKKNKDKGLSSLIEVENPNRQVQHATKKVENLNIGEETKGSLTRKEKEEVEHQRAEMRYRRLHEAGKTDEAKADLERLAVIRKQREEAAKRKEEEKKAKEVASASKKANAAIRKSKKR